MKDYPIEPRLKKLNDKLSANATGYSNTEKPIINFVNQETTVHGSSMMVNIRHPGASAKGVDGRDDSVPLRRTRPQQSLRVVFLDKNNTTGVEKAFYSDVVEPARREVARAATSSSTAHNDSTKIELRNYRPAAIEEVVHGHNR